MNNQLAKKLRRNSEIGKEETLYNEGSSPPVFERKDKFSPYLKVSPGEPITLFEGCDRFQYKKLKRSVLRSKRG